MSCVYGILKVNVVPNQHKSYWRVRISVLSKYLQFDVCYNAGSQQLIPLVLHPKSLFRATGQGNYSCRGHFKKPAKFDAHINEWFRSTFRVSKHNQYHEGAIITFSTTIMADSAVSFSFHEQFSFNFNIDVKELIIKLKDISKVLWEKYRSWIFCQ